MLDPENEKLNARLIVLERLLVMLIGEQYVEAAKRGKDGQKMAKRDTEAWVSRLAAAQFPGIDPAIADLRAAEVEDYARGLLGAVQDHVAFRLQHR